MKKLLALCALSMLCISAASIAGNDGPVEKPQVKVGDRWVYNRIDLWRSTKEYTYSSTVVGTADNDIRAEWKMHEAVIAGNVGKTGVNAYDGQWNIRTRQGFNGGKREFPPTYLPYDFPLEIGKSWAVTGTYRNSSGDGELTEEAKATVERWESVSIPAGTFDALKVVTKGHYRNAKDNGRSGTGTLKHTYWYSPEVKRFVKYEYEDTGWDGRPYKRYREELVEFKLN